MDVQGNRKDEGKQQASNNVDPEDTEALGLEGWDDDEITRIVKMKEWRRRKNKFGKRDDHCCAPEWKVRAMKTTD
eukprot:scaffold18755_cov99-Amphora_coffeaeformis.AAC.2